MSTYKHFKGPGLDVKYFPGESVILLQPQRGSKLDDIQKIREKLETVLSIQSTKKELLDGTMNFSLKLDKNGAAGVEEFLKSFLKGGEEIQTATDMAQNQEKEEIEQEASEMAAQQPQQPQQQPSMPNQPSLQPQMTEAFEVFYNSLLESTYRTATYWDDLVSPSGKQSKNAITERDILQLRKEYVLKPKSKSRDKVLRALDNAAKYFVRKFRKIQGDFAAAQFKTNYKKIGHLVPTDYSEERAPVDPENSLFGGEASNDSSSGQDISLSDLNFAEFFGDDEAPEEEIEDDSEESDAYEGFDIKE